MKPSVLSVDDERTWRVPPSLRDSEGDEDLGDPFDRGGRVDVDPANWMREEADRTLRERSVPAHVIHFFVALLFVGSTSYYQDHPVSSGVFLGALTLVGIARLTFHHLGKGLLVRRPALWRLGFDAGVLGAALVLTTLCCLVVYRARIQVGSLFLLLCASGVSAGATNTLSPRWPLLRSYLVLSLAPLVVTLFLLPDPWTRWVGAVVALLLLFHLAEGKRLHEQFRSSLETRVMLEHRRRESELLVAAVRSADESIAVTTLDGEVVHANHAHERLGLHANPRRDEIRRAIEAGTIWRGGFELEGPGGARSIEATVSPVLSPGRRLQHAVVVQRDVTARRRAEEEHARIERHLALTDRLASLGTLAAGVAHELNNPLAYVVGNLDYLARVLREGPPEASALEEMREVVADAREGAGRARRIVLDLKSFAREDRGELDMIELAKVVDLAVKMTANEVRDRARVVVDVPPGLAVRATEGRLGQVLVALLLNAGQAIVRGRPDDNQILIVARPDGDRVALEVHDTGCGIPRELGGRIFEPFFTTKPVGSGTGLGLSIAHDIVTGFGGELTYGSEVGRGTTFRVVLRGAVSE